MSGEENNTAHHLPLTYSHACHSLLRRIRGLLNGISGDGDGLAEQVLVEEGFDAGIDFGAAEAVSAAYDFDERGIDAGLFLGVVKKLTAVA